MAEAVTVSIEAAKRAFLREAFVKTTAQGSVVEIGSIRTREITADGRSTPYLAALASHAGRPFATVDVSEGAHALALEAIAPYSGALALLGDGVEMLRHLWKAYPHLCPVAYLYIDGPDNPLDTLAFFVVAYPFLAVGATVVVDDCHPYEPYNIPAEWAQPMPYGKATLLIPLVARFGYEYILAEVCPGWKMLRIIMPSVS